MANTGAGTFASIEAAVFSSQVSRCVADMSTEMARARAMTRAMSRIPAAPLRKVLTIESPESPPAMPMTIAMNRNHVVHSLKYHWPSGTPVRMALQAVARLSPVAPAKNTVMPKFSHGMNEMIMTMNANASKTSTSRWRPVSSRSWVSEAPLNSAFSAARSEGDIREASGVRAHLPRIVHDEHDRRALGNDEDH